MNVILDFKIKQKILRPPGKPVYQIYETSFASGDASTFSTTSPSDVQSDAIAPPQAQLPICDDSTLAADEVAAPTEDNNSLNSGPTDVPHGEDLGVLGDEGLQTDLTGPDEGPVRNSLRSSLSESSGEESAAEDLEEGESASCSGAGLAEGRRGGRKSHLKGSGSLKVADQLDDAASDVVCLPSQPLLTSKYLYLKIYIAPLEISLTRLHRWPAT